MNEIFAVMNNQGLTDAHMRVARQDGITLRTVKFYDPYNVSPSEITANGEFDGVVVEHPAQAMTLGGTYKIGVFEYGYDRAAEAQWSPVKLHIYDNRREFHGETLPHVVFWAGTGRVEFNISDGRSGSNPITGKETQGIVIGRILQSLGLHPNEFTYEVLGVTNV